jgi:hypothetical protein
MLLLLLLAAAVVVATASSFNYRRRAEAIRIVQGIHTWALFNIVTNLLISRNDQVAPNGCRCSRQARFTARSLLR